MLTNCIAYVKLVKNNKLNTYKAQFAFNVHKRIVGEKLKYAFPTQAKCNYVSGDLLADNLQEELERVVAFAQQTLRTTNIQIVE